MFPQMTSSAVPMAQNEWKNNPRNARGLADSWKVI